MSDESPPGGLDLIIGALFASDEGMTNTLVPAAPKKLLRSRRNRIIAGVCGGIAEYLNVNPTVVRVLYVIVSVLSVAFPGILVYLILAVIMPNASE